MNLVVRFGICIQSSLALIQAGSGTTFFDILSAAASGVYNAYNASGESHFWPWTRFRSESILEPVKNMYRLEFEVQFKRRVFIFPAKYEGATNDPLVGLRKQRISRRSSQLLALFSSYPLFLRSADSAKIIPLTPSATQTQMLVLGVEGKGHPYCHTHSKGFISYLFILHFIKRVFLMLIRFST